MRTNIQLPGFNGFYESIWSELMDRELEWDKEERGITQLDGWRCKVCEFEESVAKEYTEMYLDLVNSELGFSVKQIGPAEIDSPKYYNYRTDRIYVDVEFHDLKKLWAEMKAHKDVLVKVIHDNHTSRDGFISFMSNDFDEWLKEYLHYGHEDFGLYLSFALFYVLKIHYPVANLDWEFYETISDNVYAEWYPDTEEAKEEYEKVLIVEEYLGYGAYDSDKYGQVSVDDLRLKMEQDEFDRKYQGKFEFSE